MAYGFPDWLIPQYTPDVWLVRVRNNRDWLGLGAFVFIFTILFFVYLSSFVGAVSITQSFTGLIGLFLFLFGFFTAAIVIGLEGLGRPSTKLGLVIYGRTTTVKGLGFDLMVGGIAGLLFGLPSLLPTGNNLAISSASITPLEQVMILALFGFMEELWRTSTFEPLIASFTSSGAELPIFLLFLGIVSFFLPTFFSFPLIGIALIIMAFVLGIVSKTSPTIARFLTTSQFLRKLFSVIISVISWVLFHVYTASYYLSPSQLYLSALAFGFLVEGLNWLRQSAVPSYVAHVTNNAIVSAKQLGYNIYVSIFTIVVFTSLIAFPFVLGNVRRRGP